MMGTTYDLITTVDFEGGADNLRHDAANKRVYVACGDDEKTGAIATIDATTNQRLDEEYKLGASRIIPAREVRTQYLCQRAAVETDRSDQSRHERDQTLALKGVEENFPWRSMKPITVVRWSARAASPSGD